MLRGELLVDKLALTFWLPNPPKATTLVSAHHGSILETSCIRY